MLELGSNPRSRLRVDGRNYGIYVGGDARVTRLPIAPGAHVLDFIDDAHVYAVRREVQIKPGETKRIVLELRDALAKPVDPGAAWYIGRVNGHPSYTNTAPEDTVTPVTPRDK
jgi:hypothetical protein